MGTKIFKTLDEQVEILIGKGLTIDDVEYAKDILFKENYFFLNGYRYPFVKSLDNKVYIPGTKFEELYSLFLFDRSLRYIIFKYVLQVENNVKSILSYQLSKKYGIKEKDYLNVNNFNYTNDKKKQINDLINKMKRQVNNNAAQHTATKHYLDNYGYIPLWVLVKVLSFGIVSDLYLILKKEDQQDIANVYDLNIGEVSNYLSLLANYRNLCAHEDIVYENRTKKFIFDTKYHGLLDIETIDNEFVCGKNDLFALVIIFKSMLSDIEMNNFVREVSNVIENLEYNLRSIPIDKILDRMGFPDNWEDILSCNKGE